MSNAFLVQNRENVVQGFGIKDYAIGIKVV